MSKMRRTFVDSGVLILAARGKGNDQSKALTVLDDPGREFASSVFIELEVRPKAIYHKKLDEAGFYQSFFQSVAWWAVADDKLFKQAYDVACKYGLSGFDALHAAAALSVGADEFVTSEGATKPLHRVRGIKVISL